MDFKLTGKTALVTGSTAGIGLAIASLLAEEGCKVIVNGRTAERVDQAIAQIKKKTPSASPVGVAADVGQAAGITSLVKAVPTVDILINNAGIFDPKPFEEIPDADWIRFFETNVMSGVRLSRAYMASMKQKKWGRIIFISSESALQIPPEMIHYGMTKTAQLAVSRGLAETLTGTGVTVNAVLPGPTNSEGVGGFIELLAKNQNKDKATIEKEFFKTMRPTSIIQRLATTEEVANMVVYLCSEQASATTGASVRVDGGVVRSIA